jgi:hypothetical protein
VTQQRQQRWVTFRAAGLMSLVAGVLLLLGLWCSTDLPTWLRGALLNEKSMLAAAIALVCLVGIVGLGWGLMIIRRRAGTPVMGGQDGVAMIEFVLVFPIILMLVLVMAQSTFLMVGNLMVHYSAYCGARSAIVYIPETIDGEPANWIEPRMDGSYKFQRIQQAVLWGVMPVCSSNEAYTSSQWELVDGVDMLFRAYGEDTPHWAQVMLDRKMGYAERYTTVTLDEPDTWYRNNMWGEYAESELLRVKVEHTLSLSVPYAAAIFARMDSDGVKMSEVPGQYGMRIYAKCILTNEGYPDNVEVEEFESRWR